ncbi:uncharacterized protein LODBEIA_P03120 [Lodderomyces beijingensis]|uniref:CTLH domain-containing protein n=1 Tax=Lodderomyces beijingensis TaxID=1775926 RepID=A0ABP0ZD39_9ASCO
MYNNIFRLAPVVIVDVDITLLSYCYFAQLQQQQQQQPEEEEEEERFDLAKIYDANFANMQSAFSSDFVLETSRILHNCGLLQYEKRKFENSRLLASSVVQILEPQAEKETSPIFKERYLHGHILLIKSLKSIDTAEAQDKAAAALELLREQFPSRLETYILHLEVNKYSNETQIVDADGTIS